MSPNTSSELEKALTCCELTMSDSRRTRTAWRMAEGDFRVHGPRRWEPLGPLGPHPGTMAIFLPYNFLFLLLGSSHILSPHDFWHTNSTSRFSKIDFQLFQHTFDYTHVLLIFSSTSHQQVKKKLRFLRWCCCCCFMMGTQEFLFFYFCSSTLL